MLLQFIIKSLTDCYSHLSEDDAVRYLYWPLAKVALVSLVELGCLSYGDILCRLGQQQTLEAEESTLQQVTAQNVGASIHLKSRLSESTMLLH